MADTLFGGAALAADFDDDGEQRRRGHDATPDTDGQLTALWYLVPSTGVPSGVGSVAKMYVINDDDDFLCEVDLQAVIPAASPGWTRIDADDFDPAGPVDWPDGVRFRGWVATVGDGSPFGKVNVTDPGTFPKASTPDGHLTAASGLYGGGAVPPDTIPSTYAAYWDFDFEFTADGGDPIVIAWTTVNLALAPQAMSVTPGMVTIAWTTVLLTLAPQAVNATPGMVTVAWTTVELRLTPVPATVTPGMVTVAWTPVQLAITIVAATVTPGMVTVAWTPVLLALRVLALGLPVTLVEPGLGTPGGTVRVPTAGGTVLVPVPSGRP